ncbi:Eukaryotic translation initiation factor 3 subunit A-like 1, partial [Homarus americanus]
MIRPRAAIQVNDHNIFRLLKAHVTEARLVMHNILRWGCQKSQTQTFEDYIINDLGVARNIYNKRLDRKQKESIKSNPVGSKFDITLLYKIIQIACHSLAPFYDSKWTDDDPTRLEFLLTCIKNSRNDLAHGVTQCNKTEMVERIEQLRDLLKNTVKIGGELYGVDPVEVKDLTSEINTNLNNIRDQPFTHDNINQYRQAVLFDSLRSVMCDNGTTELGRTHSKKVYLNPLSLINDSQCHFHVRAIFTGLLIQSVRANRRHVSVNFEDLLDYCDPSFSVTPVDEDYVGDSIREVPDDVVKASVLLLEGRVGSGKTTLLKMVMSEWITGSGAVKGLSVYDLLFYVKCSDSTTDSLTKLLTLEMPETASRFCEYDLLQILLSLKVLVLMDGLDELSQSSEKIFREILAVMNSSNITLICTTRPEKIKEIKTIVSDKVNIVRLKIQGIPREKKQDFVRVYHEELRQKRLSDQDTERLVQFVGEAPVHLQDFLTHPLNLVLLSFLWVRVQGKISQLTSSTMLYIEIHELLKERMYERLKQNAITQHLPITQIQEKCKQLLSVLYQAALNSVWRKAISLDPKITHKLSDQCSRLELPPEEVLSTFLVSVLIDTPGGYVNQLSFPHKGIHDFYAANHVIELIRNTFYEGDGSILGELKSLFRKVGLSNYKIQQMPNSTADHRKQRTIRQILNKLHKDDQQSFQISIYRNVLHHLVGLLKVDGPDAIKQHAQEAVELLKSTNMSFEQLVDILTETDCNMDLAKEVSKFLPKKEWTVTNEHVQAAASLLCFNSPRRLIIDIMDDPNQIAHLESLMEATSRCNCVVQLYLHHHWRYPNAGSSDSFLSILVTGKRPVNTSGHGSQDDFHTQDLPSGHRSQDDLHTQDLPSDHGSQDDLHTQDLPSDHGSQDDLHTQDLPSDHGSQDDLHTQDLPSDHGSQDDLHTQDLPSDHGSQDDLHTQDLPSDHRSQDDLHTQDPPSAHGSLDLTTFRDDLYSGHWSREHLFSGSQTELLSGSPEDLLTTRDGPLGHNNLAVNHTNSNYDLCDRASTLREGRSYLTEALGRFGAQTTRDLLPNTLTDLHIALADDDDALAWQKITGALCTLFPDLRHLWVHVVVGVCSELLPRLPRLHFRPRLYLSGVGDEDVHGRSGGLMVASSALTYTPVLQLNELVLSRLNCPFSKVDEDDIWFDESIYEQVHEYDKLPVQLDIPATISETEEEFDNKLTKYIHPGNASSVPDSTYTELPPLLPGAPLSTGVKVSEGFISDHNDRVGQQRVSSESVHPLHQRPPGPNRGNNEDSIYLRGPNRDNDHRPHLRGPNRGNNKDSIYLNGPNRDNDHRPHLRGPNSGNNEDSIYLRVPNRDNDHRPHLQGPNRGNNEDSIYLRGPNRDNDHRPHLRGPNSGNNEDSIYLRGPNRDNDHRPHLRGPNSGNNEDSIYLRGPNRDNDHRPHLRGPNSGNNEDSIYLRGPNRDNDHRPHLRGPNSGNNEDSIYLRGPNRDNN